MKGASVVSWAVTATLAMAAVASGAGRGQSHGPGDTAGLAGDAATTAAERSPVVWSEIRLRARKLLLTAATQISVKHVPASAVEDELRPLADEATVAMASRDRVAVVELKTRLPFGRRERATAWIDATTGAALQSEKVKTGGRPYWKLRRYFGGGYFQWRAEPAKDPEKRLSNERWTRRSERQVDWDSASPPGVVVTDSYALLYLLSAHRLDREGATLKVCVSSDEKLVEAEFAAAGSTVVKVNFDEVRADGSVVSRKGRIRVRTVKGSGRLLGSESSDDDVDLGFLGMRGSITVLVEEGSGLPVEVRGRTEDIGRLTVRLYQVTPAGREE